MGRHRTKPIVAGSQVILYLPQDIDPRVLNYLNEQPNVSKILLELAYDRVYNREANEITKRRDTGSEMTDEIKAIVSELVEAELKRRTIKNSGDQGNKKSLIKNLDSESMFKNGDNT